MNEDGFREVLGAAEGMKEDKASWVSFFQWLRGRGLDGVKMCIRDSIESLANLFVGRSFTQHGASKHGCAFRVVADCHTKANYNDYFHDSERAGRV